MTFINQKNGEKEDHETQEITVDPLLSLVSQLAALVRILRNNPRSTDATPIYTFVNNNSILAVINQNRAL